MRISMAGVIISIVMVMISSISVYPFLFFMGVGP
jgi:hypothetical protein